MNDKITIIITQNRKSMYIYTFSIIIITFFLLLLLLFFLKKKNKK